MAAQAAGSVRGFGAQFPLPCRLEPGDPPPRVPPEDVLSRPHRRAGSSLLNAAHSGRRLLAGAGAL